jgi:hypothetical protein
MFTNVFVSILVYAFYVMFPKSTILKGIPLAPHMLLGNTVGLLLVFRTNSAYDRFWEARKIWGSMVSRLRALGHYAHRSLHGLDREHVLTLLAALPSVFLHHLRGWTKLPKQHDEVEYLVKTVGEDDAVVSMSMRCMHIQVREHTNRKSYLYCVESLHTLRELRNWSTNRFTCFQPSKMDIREREQKSHVSFVTQSPAQRMLLPWQSHVHVSALRLAIFYFYRKYRDDDIFCDAVFCGLPPHSEFMPILKNMGLLSMTITR